MHIRRGDRIRPDLDIRKWCREHPRSTNGSCNGFNCAELDDLGCFGLNPFGALRLSDYLERTQLLLNSSNIFVMSDDSDWLAAEISHAVATSLPLKKKWNIATIPAPKDRYSAENSLSFFSSLAMARSCGAFVGNFMSGVSEMIFNLMCFNHKHKIGECPPALDIGGAGLQN